MEDLDGFETDEVDSTINPEESFDDATTAEVEEFEAPDEGGDDLGIEIDGVDPSEIPEELQPIYDTMVRGMNAKFRELADERKALEEKAGMVDKILTDPQARAVFLASAGALNEQGQGQDQQAGFSFNARPDFDIDSAFEPDTPPAIEALIGRYLDQHVLPVVQTYARAIENVYHKMGDQEWDGLASRFPGADKHKAAVQQFRAANPQSTLEQALFAVAGPNLQAKAVKRTKPKPKPKGLSLTKQSSVPASRVQPTSNGQSLVDFTRDQMKRLGMGPQW